MLMPFVSRARWFFATQLVLLLLITASSPALATWGYDPASVYDQEVDKGTQSKALTDSFDPFSGALVLEYTDLEVPGVAGLDIVITRVYDSKIHENYAARASGDPTGPHVACCSYRRWGSAGPCISADW